MSRQHSAPVILGSDESVALPLAEGSGPAGTVTEADIQAIVHNHPASLPIAEIDPLFVGALAVCRELNTPAGPIDNFLLTPSGLPVLVECKLWRNPEGRREVVGQILDYAKELSRWSSADVQREVSRNLKQPGNPLLELVRAKEPNLDETQFNDALTANLRRGRFLLLIVGDGIREGVEAIAEYLQLHAGMHFSLGLVELPIFALPDGSRLVAPRVLARTVSITRHVVAAPEGHIVLGGDSGAAQDAAAADPEGNALGNAQQAFWREFIEGLRLEDPEQQIPRAPRQGYVAFMMPAPQGSAWLTVYRNLQDGEVGVFLSAHRNSPGDYALRRIGGEDWDEIKAELGGTVRREQDQFGRPRVIDSLQVGNLDDPEVRRRAFGWLAERLNAFVSVLRPRVRSAVADYRVEDA